jgi:hypothetical protein
MVKIHIYVEGGGDQNMTLTKCRRGFSKFFSRSQTLFGNAFKDAPRPVTFY